MTNPSMAELSQISGWGDFWFLLEGVMARRWRGSLGVGRRSRSSWVWAVWDRGRGPYGVILPWDNRVLETAEEVLGFDRSRFRHSWSILRDYGNMSSATALFVLQHALQAGDQGPHRHARTGRQR